jgi:hemerythrin superfamily protein
MTTNRSQPDACSLLDTDHKNVKKMFTAYDEVASSKSARATAQKRELAQQICAELTVHTQLEEEIFYPAVREAIKETDLLDEAEVEHASAKDLIAQIQEAEDIDEMFPKARAAKGLDLVAMREQLMARKEELMAEVMAGA